MPKGRKPIPSKIINIMGGRQHTHRPPRDQEPKPPEKVPRCPKHLDAMAKKEWRRAVKLLGEVGLLAELDMATLAGYCQAYSEWARATMEVSTPGKPGPVYIDKQGIPHMNPWIRVAKESFEKMMKCAVLIGMSPSSRASLKVEKPAPAKKPEEAKKERFFR